MWVKWKFDPNNKILTIDDELETRIVNSNNLQPDIFGTAFETLIIARQFTLGKENNYSCHNSQQPLYS